MKISVCIGLPSNVLFCVLLDFGILFPLMGMYAFFLG